MSTRQQIASKWFYDLRDQFINQFETIEQQYTKDTGAKAANFVRKLWDRPGGGGGEMSVMNGAFFEKVGVNVSTVHGSLQENFKKELPGTEESNNFFATGISIVVHTNSPLIPAAHFNTRYIQTGKFWFGGGADLTPTYPSDQETALFHSRLKQTCDIHDSNYYDKFKKNCDEYFFLKHRNEPRGIGGIFFDYLNNNNFENDFAFVKDVGLCFLDSYTQIVTAKLHKNWSHEQKEQQLLKRGRYVEFNLLYDRGTKFGLMTEGNIDAIFMSLPPTAKWV